MFCATTGSRAFARWLGISNELAEGICLPGGDVSFWKSYKPRRATVLKMLITLREEAIRQQKDAKKVRKAA